MLHQKEDTGIIHLTQHTVLLNLEDENEMSKILHIVHNIIWLIFFISIACNIAFIYINIHNNRQSGSASERIENELNNAANSFSSAERTTEQVSNGLITVSNELGESQATTNKLISTTKESVKGCGDIEQTITKLREEIQNLEKCVNSCNDNNSSNNSNTNSNKEINVDEKR